MDTIVLQIIRQILVTNSHSSALLSISASGDSITLSCLVMWYAVHSTLWFLTLAIEQGFCHPSVPIHLPNILSVLHSQLTSLQRRWTLRLCLCHSLPYCCMKPRVWFLVPPFQLCCFLFFLSVLYTGLVRTLGDKKAFRGAYPSMKCFKGINFQIFSLYLYLLFHQLLCSRRISE